MQTPNATTTNLAVGGMTCGHCARAVKAALETLPGVTKADVDLEAGRATVQHDLTVDPSRLVAAVTEEGYRAEAGPSETTGGACDGSCCQD